ncbi:heavy-metal-associated domain-containing protein [Arenibacter sp. ARW7G5Y1]|uniref:heavy-metal-associated domain-containing protein n=1 Tax=Arenibacter sp. ARW7G5Y1 TaxID=2135619 RepID=UPI000D7741A1|nr:heavy-metal-associated domain-containing protein [Arenibacter sp. ARW7G5Y1]PXX31264.1 copper chaperone CopZ [Arenibacter sp. ARW7G5Y1]
MKLSLSVQNIKCGGCAKTITTKLSQLDDISEVMVDVNSGTVSFESNNVMATQELRDVLKALGYPSVGVKNGLGDKAKSLLSCASGRMMKE